MKSAADTATSFSMTDNWNSSRPVSRWFPLRALECRYCCEGLGKRGGYNIEPGLEDACRVFEIPYFDQHLAHLVVNARCLRRLSRRGDLSRRGLPSSGGH